MASEVIQKTNCTLNSLQDKDIMIVDDEQDLWAVVDSVRIWLIVLSQSYHLNRTYFKKKGPPRIYSSFFQMPMLLLNPKSNLI
jgi:hypothetical protein